MYLKYWGIKKFPFENVTDPYFFYLSESHEEAMSRLLYAAQMRKGGAMLTGDIGCGKTLISKIYMEKLIKEGSEVILLPNPPFGAIEFLQEIIHQLGITEVPDSKSKLLQILKKKMAHNLERNKVTIIIIDEAQVLNEEAFEEARLLLNFQINNQFLLTLILIGQAELKLKVRQMEQFDQRIAIKYHIHPFGLLDTAKYIMLREKKAGFTKNVFSTKALKTIYEYTSGIPRRINSVCDLSLLIGFNKKKKFIESGIIKNIIDDLA